MARKSKKKINYPLIIGLLFLLVFAFWRYHNLRILSFNTSVVNQAKSANIKPIYIKSYPIGIDIDLKESSIINGIWQIQPNSGNFLINSSGIGENGNIILYGHNKNSIFGPLRWIEKGAIVDLIGSDDKVYKYKVEKVDTIDPNNLSYVEQKTVETLTIYTCTGFLDSKRVVVVAYPI